MNRIPKTRIGDIKLRMTSDADCTRAGWIEYIATSDYGIEYHVSAAPCSDLDGEVLVFDHDEQIMGTITGWLASWDEVET